MPRISWSSATESSSRETRASKRSRVGSERVLRMSQEAFTRVDGGEWRREMQFWRRARNFNCGCTRMNTDEEACDGEDRNRFTSGQTPKPARIEPETRFRTRRAPRAAVQLGMSHWARRRELSAVGKAPLRGEAGRVAAIKNPPRLGGRVEAEGSDRGRSRAPRD